MEDEGMGCSSCLGVILLSAILGVISPYLMAAFWFMLLIIFGMEGEEKRMKQKEQAEQDEQSEQDRTKRRSWWEF